MTNLQIICILVIICVVSEISGNAFLKSPTSRSSTWRYFGEAPWSDDLTQNTEDMMLNCGGQKTNGDLQNKCGLCGDPFNGPRENEGPNGLYAIKRPTFIYYEGEEVNVTVQVTARANGGYFRFKICNSDSSTAATQACFDANPLKLAGTTDQTIIQIPDTDGDVVVPLQLPAGLTCEYCVMQWVWQTARDWGCENRRGQLFCGMGYGNQATYVNCADFKILTQGTPFPSDFTMPDYNSEYASIFGGHETNENTTPSPVTQTTTQIQVVTTPAPQTTTTTNIPVITDPLTTPTQGGVTTTATPPSTSQIIIITPSAGPTTSGQVTTEQAEITTTSPALTTEKLVPAVIGGGGGAVVAPFFGLGPLGLGLGGLGLLFGLGGREQLDAVPEYLPSPVLPTYTVPQPIGFQFQFPQPFIAPFQGGQFYMPESQPQISYRKPHLKGYGKSYNRPYNRDRIGSGYGYSGKQFNKGPSYSTNVVSNSGMNFFELPRNHMSQPVLGYAKEPDVQITKEKKTPNNTAVTSAFNPHCAPYEQTCKPIYNGKDSTLYGQIHIFDMICELECFNGKSECPADMCACTCPEGGDTLSRSESNSNLRLRGNRQDSLQGSLNIRNTGARGWNLARSSARGGYNFGSSNTNTSRSFGERNLDQRLGNSVSSVRSSGNGFQQRNSNRQNNNPNNRQRNQQSTNTSSNNSRRGFTNNRNNRQGNQRSTNMSSSNSRRGFTNNNGGQSQSSNTGNTQNDWWRSN